MSWSLSIGRIAGTAIRVHITFLLFLVWIWFANYQTGGAPAAWSGLLFMVLLFLCVLAHEFGHIFTARAFGVPTPDVTLLPIGGVARLARIPEAPRQEFLIAIAGPAVNIVIAIAIIVFTRAQVEPQHLATVGDAKIGMVERLAEVNLFLAAFNMIPAFPMDGGRVLRAALATQLGYVRATEIAASIGQWVAFALGFIGLFYNPLLIFIAIFVYLAAASEAHMVGLRAVSRGVPVTAAMVTQFASLKPADHIDQAIETMLHTSQSEFPVVDEAGRLVGLLARGDIVRALKERGPNAPVGEAMTTGIPTIGYRQTLDEAFRVLQETGSAAIGVVDAQGRLAGLVTSGTVGEMMMVRDALPGRTYGPWGRRPADA
ncbi:MAG: site-2 protease family protein [Hyphomicrobiales bacterium]|nr:site-2 protease family protein [Hyphomicrobiales bacterium]MBV8824735.1 site-2 protease family protein [Hyphomicrobiales bacterium]MBV9429003.1 site-2 protease family protein [Bradyrhizobiaceae bacterium]